MSEQKYLPSSMSLSFVEALYEDYLRDPSSVSADWRAYFEGFSAGNGAPKNQQVAPSFQPRSIFNPASPNGNGSHLKEATSEILQERVLQLIRNYRVRG